MLVSGNAQTCFSDQARDYIFKKLGSSLHIYMCNGIYYFLLCKSQLLENHIKHEVVEKIQLVHSVANSEETKPVFSEPRRSASIACGASVCEVSMQVPTWALQVNNLFLCSTLICCM